MIRILVFGTSGGWQEMKPFLDYNKVNIEAFVDNDSSKYNSKLEGIEIIPPSDMKKFQYEYVVIASSYYKSIKSQLIDLGINESKIICHCEYLSKYQILLDEYMWENHCRSNLNKNLNLAFDPSAKKQLIVTGISYGEFGIDASKLKCDAINFALASQDLYYDYKIAEHVIRNSKNHIKTCIMGLAYYSFDYDLSKTALKERCKRVYSKILGYKHNYVESDDNAERYVLNYQQNVMSKFFDDKYIEYMSNFKPPIYDFEKLWNSKLSRDSIEEIEKNAKILAHKDFSGSYPETVKENKLILEKYFEMLEDNNIQPIVVVYPVTKYYIKNIDNSKKVKFYNIINEMHCKYNFKLLDYFDSNIFSDDEFYDSSHLNKWGAMKFTELINDAF